MTAPRGRILVLEDRPQDRLYLTTLLGYRGFSVVEAANGEEGLAAAAVGHFDLVISDVLMPKMDGYEFVRRLRRTAAGADVPVLFYTATYREREARELAAECGVVEVMIKPSEPEALLAKIDEVLSRGRVLVPAIADEPFERRHALVTSDKLLEKVRDLEASERRLAALLQVGHRLIEERDPVTLLDRVCTTVRETTLATYAMVALFSEDGKRMSLVITSGHEEPVADQVRALGELPPPIQKVAVDRRPLRGRTPHGKPQYFTWHPPVSSYLLVPLISPDRVLGVIAVAGKIGAPEFSDADEQLASILGAQAGTAYENARLINELEAKAAMLREREETTEFALSAAGVGIYERNLLTNQIRQSQALARMFGVPDGATLDDLYAIFDPDDRDRSRQLIERAIRDGSDFNLDFKAAPAGRSGAYFHARGRVETTAQGTPTRLVSVVIDMTDRRTLEGQLRQAQKMEAIGQLASGVAHDFNNLLTVINGYSLFLLESAVDDDQRNDANAILEAGRRAEGLTRQLLAFSRTQAREIAVFDLNVLIQGLSGMLIRLIGAHVSLVTILGDAIGPIRDDRGQIEQVIMNLVVNARDAMPEGGEVRLETSTATVDGTEWVRLVVSDTGTGMSDEVKARLFEPFFTTKAPGYGTGLGMAVVFSIISQSGGRLSVESVVGAGSTFTILLPRTDAPVTRTEVATPTRVGGTESILLVEDEEPVRQLARVILERAGYRVQAAADGAAALTLCAQQPQGTFDLVVTDVLMPGRTGPDLFRQLSASCPELRVLYVSGYARETILDVRRLDRQAGFLAKPFTAESLTQKVREVLDR